MTVLGGSVLLFLGTVLIGLGLDARAVKRLERKQNRARPIVPDFRRVER